MKKIISSLLVLIFSSATAIPFNFDESCEMMSCQIEVTCCSPEKTEISCGMGVVEGESIPLLLPVAPLPKGIKLFSLNLFHLFQFKQTDEIETAFYHQYAINTHLDYYFKIPVYYKLHSLLI